MTPPPPPRPPRRSKSERWVRRTSRTLVVLAMVSGGIAYVIFGILMKLDKDTDPAYQPLFYVCVTVFLITAVGRVLWGLFVFVRKAVRRGPRRRALRAMAARIGWQWFARRKAIPAETRGRLHQIDPVQRTNDDPKHRYTELVYGTFAGRPALSVHVERDSRLLPKVDQLVALELPGVLPELRITDRSDDPFGLAPAQQFESARFNESWHVYAQDQRYASAFTHPQLMRLLNGLDVSITAIHLRGAWLISRAPVSFSPQLLQLHLDALARIAEAVPDWVWDEYGSVAAGAWPRRDTV